jgi:cysteinyl-tRNA synthetase
MLRLENTLTGKKEEFSPSRGNTVRFYTCGPTVYNFAHIGNLRTYIFEDVLRRTFKYEGFGVRQVMNITDIDDKIIKRMIAEKKSIKEITIPYIKAFLSDIKKLNIERPEVLPKATAHIKEMISLTEKLLKKGYAYKGQDGSIYFDITKFADYGKLAKIDKDNLLRGVRVEADEYNKDEARDFVLWKAKKEGESSWKSPFGEGRPGWHIECSAMSMRYLGESFDVHTGAVDNIFPHHENEIAQSEAATGKPFARIWMHAEHLLVNGEKMAKSAGNFYTLRDIEEKGYSPLAFRYLVLGTHYRSKLNFSWDSLEAAQNGLKNLIQEIRRISALAINRYPTDGESAERYRQEFGSAIKNDLGSPDALAALWGTIRDKKLSPVEKLALIKEFDRVLGLGISDIKTRPAPKKVKNLISDREEARKMKNFDMADSLRKEVEVLGYEIEDTPGGPVAIEMTHHE